MQFICSAEAKQDHLFALGDLSDYDKHHKKVLIGDLGIKLVRYFFWVWFVKTKVQAFSIDSLLHREKRTKKPASSPGRKNCLLSPESSPGLNLWISSKQFIRWSFHETRTNNVLGQIIKQHWFVFVSYLRPVTQISEDFDSLWWLP